MSVLDTYFNLQENMRNMSKTNCSDKEIKLYFDSGEKILSILDKVVKQFIKEWGETPPTMYCRDELPDMYMRYGQWDKARKAIDRCHEVKILNQSERYNQQNWINNCEVAVKEVISHLKEYPGTLQKDMYTRLHYIDKDAMKWTLRFYRNIEKVKYKNTNKLFLPEQSDLISKEMENLEKENANQESKTTNNLPDIPTNIVTPEWYVSISFGESTSKNYSQVVALAKLAPQYIENIIENKIIHQAIFSDKPNEYLQFIKLYESVSNWKSCYVVINGIMVDRKVIGNLNYCYGDKCRSGKSDFCYGASDYTSNPFGCHRAQMHAYNDPWYSYGIIDTKRIFHIDKNSIKNELTSRLNPYRLCPALDIGSILENVDKLPDTINPKINKDWEYTTIMKNGTPSEGVQPTLEARGLAYTITLNLDSYINNDNEKTIIALP
ncbi:hypothetical protein NE686_19575 [Tissierella carlieri]|uniref:Uncharacterized protein n=1 Tax=Tissierella carlieri TaxID=689904 RepID=A0ABT1SFN7_9FIRM|nr:hypothetical protein [Tissierella carlieri]MCQ4925314.1 hypothetical protein [Tissierella carlieri]